MEGNYFQCRPGELCEGSKCCSDIETQPSLSVGDYFRISRTTNMAMPKIWRRYGDVSLNRAKNKGTGIISIGLGLLHDPCSYLTEDGKCSVYEQRPLVCAAFPYLLLRKLNRQLNSNYSKYECLKNVELSEEQIKFSMELDGFFEEEASLELKYFWLEGPLYIDVSITGTSYQLLLEALRKLKENDPDFKTKRGKKLLQSGQRLNRSLNNMVNGIYINDFIEMMKPIIYTLMKDDVCNKFNSLPEEAIREYEDVSNRYIKFLKSHELIQIK